MNTLILQIIVFFPVVKDFLIQKNLLNFNKYSLKIFIAITKKISNLFKKLEILTILLENAVYIHCDLRNQRDSRAASKLLVS